MAQTQTFVFDNRLPVSENLPTSDPTHPKNVLRNALIVQNQAAADTKYDIYPPPRVEAFSVPPAIKEHRIYVISAILAAFVGLILLFSVQGTFVRGALIFVVVICLHYLASQLHV